MKDNCSLFVPIPYFRSRAIRWCHLNIFPADSHCYGNEFWDEIDYNSAPAKDNCTLFSPTPYFWVRAMQWYHVNFFPEDPCCHGNQPFLFKNKIGCRVTRASNAETQLLGYIHNVAMKQIPRFTERISSFYCSRSQTTTKVRHNNIRQKRLRMFKVLILTRNFSNIGFQAPILYFEKKFRQKRQFSDAKKIVSPSIATTPLLVAFGLCCGYTHRFSRSSEVLSELFDRENRTK